jgi:hypothetical protein
MVPFLAASVLSRQKRKNKNTRVSRCSLRAEGGRFTFRGVVIGVLGAVGGREWRRARARSSCTCLSSCPARPTSRTWGRAAAGRLQGWSCQECPLGSRAAFQPACWPQAALQEGRGCGWAGEGGGLCPLLPPLPTCTAAVCAQLQCLVVFLLLALCRRACDSHGRIPTSCSDGAAGEPGLVSHPLSGTIRLGGGGG